MSSRANGGTHDGFAAQSSAGPGLDVSDLVSIPDDRAFVDEAYLRILGRKCDLVSLSNCLEMLGNHVPRRVILLQLVNSDEARQRGIRFVGIPEPTDWQPVRSSSPTIFSRFRRFLMARMVELAKRILFVRFDAINYKLTFLMRALETRTDDLSLKNEQAFRLLSEKVDELTRALHQRDQDAGSKLEQAARTLEEKLDAASFAAQARAKAIEAQVTGALSVAVRTLEEKLDAASSEAQAKAKTLEAQVTGMRSASEADRNQFVTHLSHLQNQVTSVDRELAEITARMQRLQETDDRTFIELTERDKTRKPHPAVLRGGDNVLVTEVDGFILGLPGEEWRLAAYYTFRGLPEPGLTTYFQQLVKPGMVVLDIGANIGIYTLYAARLLAGHGRVHSFEPTPRTFQILRDNIQVNGFLESGVIELHQCAVSDCNGEATLTVFPNNCGHNTLFGNGSGTNAVQVPTVSLDQQLSEPVIDVVKLDAEGAEPLILRGMRGVISRNPRLHILMEFAPSNLRRAGFDPKEFLDEIKSFGFQVSRIHDETGALSKISCDQLVSAFSVNLDLVRDPGVQA